MSPFPMCCRSVKVHAGLNGKEPVEGKKKPIKLKNANILDRIGRGCTFVRTRKKKYIKYIDFDKEL